MKGTSTVVFDRDRLNTNLVDIAFHLDAVVELISAAGGLFDEERYDLPAGGRSLTTPAAAIQRQAPIAGTPPPSPAVEMRSGTLPH
jgi:hypothetical protein